MISCSSRLKSVIRHVSTDLSKSLSCSFSTNLFHSVLDVVGRTPIIRLNQISLSREVNVYAKCESFNPMGSVKDRLAVGIIEWAEKNGQISPGQTVIEGKFYCIDITVRVNVFSYSL
jgi:predicted alternative tryptophan synthase beta-subunit